jgi:hypothetical protein
MALSESAPRDPVIEACKAGVDRTLIRERRACTPAERVDDLVALARFAEKRREPHLAEAIVPQAPPAVPAVRGFEPLAYPVGLVLKDVGAVVAARVALDVDGRVTSAHTPA